MKKLVALGLTFFIFASLLCGVYASGLGWDGDNKYISESGGYMPFFPENKYTSQQNPPSFTWPYITNAKTYDLIVCSDQSLKKVIYQKKRLAVNFYNFDCTFKTGVDYYWSVRYQTTDGATSEWSDVRRFRIDPNAYEFCVDGIDKLLAKVPKAHPRVWTTQRELSDFRDFSNQNYNAKLIFDETVEKAREYVENGAIPSEPKVNDSDISGRTSVMTGMIQTTAFAYLLTGEKEIGDFAIELMAAVSKWDWDDKTGATSYTKQDQAYRDITLKTAMAYDWVYDLIQRSEYENEKKIVQTMIQGRTNRIIGLVDSIRIDPYYSHGWTALGYIGVIGLAMYGDIPDASRWLKDVIPVYTAVLPPWSEQDGGWSQGTDYWQYSTNSGGEFMDALAISGVLDLYKSAWMQNQYLWSLYVYPEGSYGSFGDGSNRYKAEEGGYSSQAMNRIAAFTGNPVAKWLAEQTGGVDTSFSNYYLLYRMQVTAHVPTDYPLSHEFKDIGWAVMTNDLIDSNRIQLTFKSSPWGSYNHSHADQNSFIIQAYGENLAIKSGYYDSYHTTHDNNITRKTFAHNTITTDDTDGQGYYTDENGSNDTLDAKGRLVQFANHMSFDSLTGDATDAYLNSPAGNTEAIGKYVRNIVYLRPDTFIVIDDLKTKNEKKSQFKWWLNSENPMEYGDNYAIITKGLARLKANVVYPKNTKAAYYAGFYDLKGKYWPTNKAYEGRNEQDRVSFATPLCASTKMVTTMNVYKENDAARDALVTYSGDKKCMRLSYGDTVVLVNLTDGEVTCDGIKFDGAAVTYNRDSIMMTDGTKLYKDNTPLITSSNRATIAMGCGQLCISSDDDAEVFIKGSNGYLDGNGVDRLVDLSGRSISPAIGLTPINSADGISLKAQRGTYCLTVSENNPVHINDMIPSNVRLSKNDGILTVTWDGRNDCGYDVEINGSIVNQVESPYVVIPDTDEDISVRVRATMNHVISDWSDRVNYCLAEEAKFGTVKYMRDAENKLIAEMYVSGVPDNAVILTARYDSDYILKNLITTEPITGTNRIEIGDVDENSTDTIKIFIAEKNTLQPMKIQSIYRADTTDLNTIFVNDKEVEEFSNEKDTYTVDIPESEADEYPSILAEAVDGTERIVYAHNYNTKETKIKITSQSGKKRTIVIKFNVIYENKHKVKGADTSNKFVKDSDTSDGTMVSGAATFTYQMNNVSRRIPLSLYSKTQINGGGSNFGSRLCSDRATNSGNKMGLESLADDLTGWDYFVLPNDGYYSQSSQCSNEKITFALADDAEIVVLGTGKVESLKNNGFQSEIGSYGVARYMNVVGDEDIYYNTVLNGKSVDDVDASGRLKNYDLISEWVDVNPLTKIDASTGDKVNYTKEDYEKLRPSKDQFTKTGIAKPWTHSYYFSSKYSKTYRIEREGKNVTLDLSGMGGNKILVIVKGKSLCAPIENINFLGPIQFDDIEDVLMAGCTDDSQNKAEAWHTWDSLIKYDFSDGAKAYYDDGVIKLGDDAIGLEGACYFPIYTNLLKNWNLAAWQKAYYFGTTEVSGYQYPRFADTLHDWYSFDLTKPAYLYVVCSGAAPGFIDSSWEKVSDDRPLFSTTGIAKTYRNIYKKYIHVDPKGAEHVVMQTPGSGGSAYYLLIKPEKE